jgi:hypothetical protein
MSTYTLISSQVLGSSAASVTFSSIPQNYRDIVMQVNARSDSGSVQDTLLFNLNGDSAGTNFSGTFLRYIDSTINTGRTSNTGSYQYYINGGSSTSGVFSNAEIYVPNYTSTVSKPFSSFMVPEHRDVNGREISIIANLYRNSSAITSITMAILGASNFVAGSSFYLYGI